MEQILLVLESWWWAAPAAVAAGAVGYAGLTTRSRRARRLELDASRHEEAQAHRALAVARAQLSAARAQVLSARSRSGGLIASPAIASARRDLQNAKRLVRSASLELRASRTRVRASAARWHAASRAEPLPIEGLFAAHDAVTARWMEYETDVAKAIAYPQLTDPGDPATLAFLRVQREAQRLRPGSARDRISPQQFIDYRAAVTAMSNAVDEAERQAGAAPVHPTLPGRALPRPGVWPVPGRLERPPASG